MRSRRAHSPWKMKDDFPLERNPKLNGGAMFQGTFSSFFSVEDINPYVNILVFQSSIFGCKLAGFVSGSVISVAS